MTSSDPEMHVSSSKEAQSPNEQKLYIQQKLNKFLDIFVNPLN